MRVNQDKLRQKLQFMRNQLRALKKFQEMDIDQFMSDEIYEAAATRMLQVAVESMLDICAHVVSREGWGLPKTYVEAVELVVRNDLLPSNTEGTFKAMARFRNRVVHLYDDVDANEIWEIIQNRLPDFKTFMASVIDRYLT